MSLLTLRTTKDLLHYITLNASQNAFLLYIYVYQNIDVLKTECELILKQLLGHNLVNDSRVSVFTALKDYMYVQNETLF